MTPDYDPNLPHALWVRHQPDGAAELPLLLLHLWWGWGTLQHQPSAVDPGTVVTEAWRPDAVPHVGHPATECPACIDQIRRSENMHDPDLGIPRTARKSPLHP